MSFALLTQSTTPIIGWIAKLFGYVMNLIYEGFSRLGINNIGLCIIVFTAIVNIILIPLTIKQQKTMKLQNAIQPEIKAIQAKYKGKNDSASQQKMQAEVQAVNEKYGVSMFGGCLPLVIQLPILYGLYAVIRNIPAYVNGVRAVYMNIVEPLIAQSNFTTAFGGVIEGLGRVSMDAYTAVQGTAAGSNWVIDALYQFNPARWGQLTEAFPRVAETINSNLASISHFNNFLGLDIATTPATKFLSPMMIIPILSAIAAFVSIKLTSGTSSQQQAQDNPMGGAMGKSMNATMPIMSLIFGFMLPVGLGLYWIASSVFRTIITVIINKSIKDVDPLELAEKAKAKKRRKNLGKSKKEVEEAEAGTPMRDKLTDTFRRLNASDAKEVPANEQIETKKIKSVYEWDAELPVEDPKAKKKRIKKGQSRIPMESKVRMVQDYNAIHGEPRRKKK